MRLIFEFIAHDKPKAANDYVQRLLTTAEKIAIAPHGYAAAPEGFSQDGLLFRHCCALPPYRIIYTVDDCRVVIEGFRHGSRQPGFDQ